MTSEPVPQDDRVGRFPAHLGAAIVALAAALAVQVAWPTIAARSPAASWWPLDAAAIAAATAYLMATAWLHWGAARWEASDLQPRLWRLGRGLAADVAVGLLALVVLIRGQESGTIQAGLSLLPPLLIATTAISLAVSLLALQGGLRRLKTETTPAADRQSRTELIRALVAVGLLLAIVALERYQPTIKPWEAGSPAASSTPATGH
jgi:hypothetical protein